MVPLPSTVAGLGEVQVQLKICSIWIKLGHMSSKREFVWSAVPLE